ncbi:MAG: helix-turn-helix domain-containing protein [Candidatus Margulisiibacteriota bacterium]|jgi:DNA (cytosine-5)-methyltransferase 1
MSIKKEFVNIKKASKILGVSPDTLRRWDNAGKLKAYRNPINKYRVYKKDELEKFIRKIEQSKNKYE